MQRLISHRRRQTTPVSRTCDHSIFSRRVNHLQQPTQLLPTFNITPSLTNYRYEIKDLDPDMHNPAPYRASVQHLIPIPPTNASLPSLTPRRQVLALYPGTTTFYKAEVVAAKTDGKPLPEGSVRLRFEGEDEADREMDVERRYVMMEGVK